MLPQSCATSVDIALQGVGERSHMTKERLTQTPPCPTAVHQTRHMFFAGCRNSHAASNQPDDKNIKSNLPCTPGCVVKRKNISASVTRVSSLSNFGASEL